MRFLRSACGYSAALTFILFIISGQDCICQRQTPGRPSVVGYVSFGGTGAVPSGGGISWCNHDFVGYSAIGVDVFRGPHVFTEPGTVSGGEVISPESVHELVSTDLAASFGYLYRVAAPRSRVVVLSAGGHVLVGAKVSQEVAGFDKVSGTGKNSSVGVLIGVVPEAQLEVFPAKSVSLFASARPRIRVISGLAGKDRWLIFSAGCGIKVYL